MIVSHHCLIINRQPKLRHLLGQIGTVGIYNVAKQYFGSYCYKFCNHLYPSFLIVIISKAADLLGKLRLFHIIL